MYHNTDFLRGLLEAEDEIDTSEPVEKKSNASDDKDDSNKDIKNDSKDVSSDKDDFSDKGESDDNSDDTEDESATDDDSGSSDSTDGSDSSDSGLDGESDDIDSEKDDSQNIIEKRKKLNLYGLFSNMVVSFKNLDDAFEKIANLDLPPSNAKFIAEVKNKVIFDLEAVNELILDLNAFTVRTYAELLAIYKIYYSDLLNMSEVLKLFMKADQNFSRIISKASQNSGTKKK